MTTVFQSRNPGTRGCWIPGFWDWKYGRDPGIAIPSLRQCM